MQRKKVATSKMSQYVTIFVLIGIFILLLVYFIFLRVFEYYQQMDPMLHTIKKRLEPLHPRVKTLHFYEGKKSYTINKKKIYLCLRNSKRQYYSVNMLTYVALHELAHVLCDEIGHTDKFYKIFKDLLHRAQEIGVYDPHQPIEKNYCGHT
jgi:type IV secretory pathway VirB3-like protein